jgi:hypothetical protein
LFQNPKEGELGREGTIILKWISKKWDGTIFIWLRIGTFVGSCGCCYEPPGSLKRQEIF